MNGKEQRSIQQFGEINLPHLAVFTLIHYYPGYEGFKANQKRINKTGSPVVYPNILRLKANHLFRSLRRDNLVE